MKQKFIVEVSFSAMNEMSLYERLRDAVFEWQTTEPKVKSVSVLPVPPATAQASIFRTKRGDTVSIRKTNGVVELVLFISTVINGATEVAITLEPDEAEAVAKALQGPGKDKELSKKA
jgi:hypothetical protein